MIKKDKIIFSVMLLSLIFISFIIGRYVFYFLISALNQYNERVSEKESSIDYLIAGRGCNDFINKSDEELKNFIQQEIRCCVSKKRIRKIIYEEQKGYSSGKYEYSNCVPIEERVLKILDSI